MKINFTPEEINDLLKGYKFIKSLKEKKKFKRRDKLSFERLHELLFYDSLEGHFYWTSKAGRKKAGKRAEARNRKNYRTIIIDNITYPAHRLAWLYMEGYFPEEEIDHINRCKYDNRWKNLRHVTRACNARNIDISSRNTSGVKGVRKCGNKWYVSIGHGGKNISLNSYSDLYTAIKVRWEAEKILNYPDCETTSTAYIWLQEYEKRQKQIQELLDKFNSGDL